MFKLISMSESGEHL